MKLKSMKTSAGPGRHRGGVLDDRYGSGFLLLLPVGLDGIWLSVPVRLLLKAAQLNGCSS